MRNQKGQSRREDTDSGGTARNYFIGFPVCQLPL